MRKTYTSEYKAKAVLEVLREEETLAQIAAKYEVHPNQLGRWKKEVLAGMPELLGDKRKKDVELKEKNELVTELYTQIGELTSKLTWLKKKSGIDV